MKAVRLFVAALAVLAASVGTGPPAKAQQGAHLDWTGSASILCGGQCFIWANSTTCVSSSGPPVIIGGSCNVTLSGTVNATTCLGTGTGTLSLSWPGGSRTMTVGLTMTPAATVFVVISAGNQPPNGTLAHGEVGPCLPALTTFSGSFSWGEL